MQNTTKNIKLIVFDVDGTLVDDNKNIHEKTISVIHELQNKGINVSLATGKTYPSIENLIKILDIQVPLILANGAIIQRPNREMVFFKYLSPDVIKEIILPNHQFEADLALYTPDRIFVEKETFNTDHMKCIFKEKIEAVGNWAAIQDFFPQICKAVWINRLDIPMIKKLTEYIQKKFDGHLYLSTATPDSIEAMSANVSKKKGLSKLAEYLQIPLDSVMVFGDQLNDREMIEAAGIGVAVENAIEEVKIISNYVIGANNDEGPANFLSEFFNLN
jgi:Cof subfamily protein (haloacid dehalogenase superfamily)